jgi:hypothetical protein
MAMSDCPHCWETPCLCTDGYGYRHLSINELLDIKRGVEALIKAKRRRGVNQELREHELA